MTLTACTPAQYQEKVIKHQQPLLHYGKNKILKNFGGVEKKIPEKKLCLAMNKTPGRNQCLQRLMDQLGL